MQDFHLDQGDKGREELVISTLLKVCLKAHVSRQEKTPLFVVGGGEERAPCGRM